MRLFVPLVVVTNGYNHKRLKTAAPDSVSFIVMFKIESGLIENST